MDKYKDLEKDLAKYKGIVFDLDKTLVDLNVDWNELKNKLSEFTKKEKGEDINFTPLDQNIHQIKKNYGNLFYFQLINIISEFELCEKKYKINNKLINLLEKFNNKKIAIYSMNTKKCVENFIKKNLEQKPDIIIAKDNCIEPKPTEKDLEKIAEKWKLSIKEIAYIGDSENDRLSGEKAGIKTYII